MGVGRKCVFVTLGFVKGDCGERYIGLVERFSFIVVGSKCVFTRKVFPRVN